MAAAENAKGTLKSRRVLLNTDNQKLRDEIEDLLSKVALLESANSDPSQKHTNYVQLIANRQQEPNRKYYIIADLKIRLEAFEKENVPMK